MNYRKEIMTHSDKMNLLCDMYLNNLFYDLYNMMKRVEDDKRDYLTKEQLQFVRYLRNKLLNLQKNAETRVTFSLDDFMISQLDVQMYENFIKDVLF